MRIANLTVYCEIFDITGSVDLVNRRGPYGLASVEILRKQVFPIEVTTSDGALVPSEQLARSIRAAAELIGLTPMQFSKAMVDHLNAESDTLSALMETIDGVP